MSSKLLRGTFLLTLGTIISKILGLLYVIPFNYIVGKEGAALYTFAYIPYTIFISIATAGVPLAISKFISKYNSLEEYSVGRKLFKSGFMIMGITGILSFIVLYLSAPLLAEISIKNSTSVSVEDVTTVIRAVSFALIIVPCMSLIRGFFQGHQSMGPSAVSQVIEQIVRILFMLLGAYIVLNIFNGELVTAVSIATFSATIGAIGSLGVLVWYWYKRKSHLDNLLEKDKKNIDITLKDMYKEIIIYAAPFVFVGLANPLFQFIDQITFVKTMGLIGLEDKAVSAFAVLSFNTHKLIIIPVSLATAFSLTLVPTITKAFIEKDFASLNKQLNQTFQIVLFFTLPAVVGISVLSEPIYTLFYSHYELGTEILKIYAPAALFFAFFTITAAILQGIDKQKFTIYSLIFGLIVKFCLNTPLIKTFETKGAVIATIIGYFFAILINMIVIKVYTNFSFKFVIRRGILISFITFIMLIGTQTLYKYLIQYLPQASKLNSFIIVLSCTLIGITIYFYLCFKSKLIFHIFGGKINRILNKLTINNNYKKPR